MAELARNKMSVIVLVMFAGGSISSLFASVAVASLRFVDVYYINKGDTRVPADNGQLFSVGNHWQSE
jgi:hypothetical protein